MKLIYPVILSSILSATTYADTIESIEITGRALDTSSTDQLEKALSEQQVNFAAGGGLSPLPVLNGMMGDRIQILADGAPITAACGNQMNPPLSYVTTSKISSINVLSGVSPVSAGGDNIAGVIVVDTLTPVFGEVDAPVVSGEAGFHHKSVNNRNTYYLSASIANDTWYASYAGQSEEADSYENGAGEKVLDTLYKAQSHALTFGYEDAHQMGVVKLSYQSIPYQGFAGQYMDMTDNRSYAINAKYRRHFSDVQLDTQAVFRDVSHEMGFFTSEKPGTMPMNTDSQDIALKLAWEMPLTTDYDLVVGQEYYANTLDDRWPAIEGSMMMGPNDYVNINDGKRERAALYAEVSGQPYRDWSVTAGTRVEYVTTDTGPVQPYSDGAMAMGGGMAMSMANPDADAAMAFNMADRDQQDTLVDISAQASYDIDAEQKVSFGLARKNRVPSLYERYTWGRGVMATTMIGWFADGNGYVGNIDLAPETAYTASAMYTFESQRRTYSADVWYTHADDYIDVQKIGEFNQSGLAQTQRNQLQFTNLDARLMGISIEAGWLVADNQTGQWQLSNTFTWQDGIRKDSDAPLYQIQPVQNQMQLTHSKGDWQSSVQWQWTGNKFDTDPLRLENSTDAYSVINLQTQVIVDNWKIELAVDNLLDKQYQLPLGGVSIADFKQNPENGFAQLDGPGRSLNFGIEYHF
ncbi:TonB-dependent receptor [Salinimonas chungwhensis]|uniref:TonB-dependent receptor n=1 Tax=Salinimonas chungwhensis TaxID=265425 RepID=UPI000367204E|nr:TonB-dependent receptor [Salinimonas chungwhensis]